MSTENKTTTNLAWLFLRPIWPSRIPLTMYFDGRGTLRRKWRQFVIFFLSWLFAPFILLLAFYLIMSFARFCNLKKLPFWGARVLGTSSNHRRRSRRGGEGHEGSSGSRPQPITFQPNSENCKRYKKRTSKLRLSSLRSKCDTIPGYNLT